MNYFGLNPRVPQSGLGLAQYGWISKHGRSQPAPCWSRSPGGGEGARTAQSLFLRIRNKRGHQVAAVARKLAMLIWHMLTKQEGYLWVRPSLLAAKQRQLRRAQRTRCWSSRFSLRLQCQEIAQSGEGCGRAC